MILATGPMLSNAVSREPGESPFGSARDSAYFRVRGILLYEYRYRCPCTFAYKVYSTSARTLVYVVKPTEIGGRYRRNVPHKNRL